MDQDVHWLPEPDYKKAVGQFRMQLNGVFEPFHRYGLQDYIPGAIDEVVKLTEDFSLRCRGMDKPLSLERIRNKRR